MKIKFKKLEGMYAGYLTEGKKYKVQYDTDGEPFVFDDVNDKLFCLQEEDVHFQITRGKSKGDWVVFSKLEGAYLRWLKVGKEYKIAGRNAQGDAYIVDEYSDEIVGWNNTCKFNVAYKKNEM